MLRRITQWLIDAFYLDLPFKTPDRTVLEKEILPWLATRPATARVLFVGCAWYTYGYRRWFPEKTYWTLDPNPSKGSFGSPLHIVDSLTNLTAHFEPQSLDLIICNGVVGWGLNAPNDIEAAIAAVHRCLRPGGLFLLGWNDVPEHRPVPLENIAALRSMELEAIGPLGVSEFLARGRNRHTFNLYHKP